MIYFLANGSNLFNIMANGIDKKETINKAMLNFIRSGISFSKPELKFKRINTGITKKEERKNNFPPKRIICLMLICLFFTKFVDIFSTVKTLVKISKKSFIISNILLIFKFF